MNKQKEFTELRFRTEITKYYKKPNFKIKPDKYVIAKVEKGYDIALVKSTTESIKNIPKQFIVNDKLYILREATKRDIEKMNYLPVEEERANEIFSSTLEKYPIQMKLFRSFQQIDNKKITFMFTAKERVDFRLFVRELAQILSKRIELTQISQREKARIISGIGLCGNEYCCSRFLTTFNQVSIKNLKKQNQNLNYSKLSGPCGKLLCCLNYEKNNQEILSSQKIPKIGDKIKFKGENMEVVKVNMKRETVYFASNKNSDSIVILPFEEFYKNV